MTDQTEGEKKIMKDLDLSALIEARDGQKPQTEPTLRANVDQLNFWYGDFQALKNINLPVHDKKVTALIGASGCGKSTLLRCFNRMHDLYHNNRYEGAITLYPEGDNIVGAKTDPMLIRLRVGMVFQKPNPFPKSIYENVAAGLRIRGINKRAILDDKVEAALTGAALWDEVKDRLNEGAYSLSGGQQQRLCIARALAPEPELLLLDEPTSALDPIATAKVEDLIEKLADNITILIVTHNMQQAARISDHVGYMHLGEMVEFDLASRIFVKPRNEQTRAYVTGRFG
ncbi:MULTISPECIES: phosphate ABC transporter ATP-binding protein PstB [unclassified Iodidimonas]|uniref:phosphate ABC transporter ATP-binding protein PstB n=1 Tax=unclassified Iodidimonas TaxID=2626145 RepID=UPI0024828ED7|nr:MULTISPECIES: phosphate ABC transporter ATP-binding protein PstB [unclassified Iodidimonas]